MINEFIKVKNSRYGVIELSLFQYGRGEWSYSLDTVNGHMIATGCDAEPMTKKDAAKSARLFGKTMIHTKQYGFCSVHCGDPLDADDLAEINRKYSR